MTDPAPRWQFKLADLLVACALVAVFFVLFTVLPLKFERDDYRAIPALIFAAWIGCLARQLRKGRLWSRPRTNAWLLFAPFLGPGEYFVLVSRPPEDSWDLLVLMICTSGWTAMGIALSWMYGRSSRP